jgi:putative acetyltransferase
VVPPEVQLVDELRASQAWLPRFSLVAINGDHLVGHVVCTRGHVGTEPVLALGPIGVEPAMQNRGVGQALMHAVIAAADALDEPLIGLLGSPAYYARFGFGPAASLGITPPDPAWGDHFQARALSAYRPEITGHFRYPPPFDRL